MKTIAQTDGTLLHGRAEEVREVVQNCLAERFTVVTGEPGMGVTSLLQAGVAPELRREGFIVATFGDWQGRFFETNLKEAIATAVRESADPNYFRSEDDSLPRLLDKIAARVGKPVAILLDHFEDYIRCHVNTVTSDKFDADLAHAIASRKAVFVVGLPDHAVPAFGRLNQYIPNLLGFRVQLGPLSAEAARETVESEARSRGMEVEPAAMDALLSASTLNSATSNLDRPAVGLKRIHPFFLKLAAGQLLEAEEEMKSTVLRAATIASRDGVDRVVLESFDPALAELSRTQTDLFFRWCNILISPKTERLSVTEKGLKEYAGRWARLVSPLLTKLTEMGVLRSVETPEALRYEISRECFVPILRDWRQRHEAAVIKRRRAIFRVTSISVATSAIVLIYLIWFFISRK